MPISLLYWTIYLLALFLGVWLHYPFQPAGYRPLGVFFVIFVLLFLLGLHDFGPAIRVN